MVSPQLQMAKDAYKAIMDSGAKTPQELRVVFEKFAAASSLPPDIKSEKVNAGGIEAEWISAPNAVLQKPPPRHYRPINDQLLHCKPQARAPSKLDRYLTRFTL